MTLGERKTWYTQNEEGRDIFDDMMQAFGYCALDGSEHYFHVYRRQYVNYICLSDDVEVKDQNVNFDYMDRVSREFDEKFQKDKILGAKNKDGVFNKRFQKNIRTAAHYFNIHHDAFARDKNVQRLMVQVDSLKDVLGRNIALSLKHTEDLDRLVEKSDKMTEDASVFKKRANIMKNKMWRKLWMCRIMIGVTVVFVIYLFLAMKCGFALNMCRAGGGGGGDDNKNDNAKKKGKNTGEGCCCLMEKEVTYEGQQQQQQKHHGHSTSTRREIERHETELQYVHTYDPLR
eukprot:CAMPEP_0194028952 /NCGR_PEP_ID=MMETSP0009_2-20130614/2822_1 /TAXON_ID=210454 /ORGANISM="Grammatophora oceanica, Strain CCMP 410" /LENGTH=287 /DNA_ID=CAMNT_0038668499 /DNA_START=154 /DNA_END=1014 /DNA_ORIENTATION=-